jgi:hypothetical protein
MKRFGLISILVAGFAAAIPSSAQATSISFHVQVNTAALIGNPSAPFYLDFALIDGSGTLAGPNSVVISSLGFAGGGSLNGAPSITGGVTGNLASSVSLSDNANAFNEYFQAFTPGTALGFDVTATTNADPITPDAFMFAILDKNLFNLPTNGQADSLVFVNILPFLNSNSLAGIQTFSTTNPVGVTATASAIPEPGTLLLLGTGITALVRRRRK